MSFHEERVMLRTDHHEEKHDSRETPAHCTECDGRVVYDEQHGDILCSECGLVVGECSAEQPQDIGSNESAEQRGITRSPETITKGIDRERPTIISWGDTGADGTELCAHQRRKAGRLRLWNERLRTGTSKERSLGPALTEIDRMCSALGVPENTRDVAGTIFRKAHDEGLLVGYSIEGIATATVCAATRELGIPRPFHEISAMSRVNDTEFRRSYRHLTRELDLTLSPVDPEDYVAQIASKLDASEKVQQQAHLLLRAGKQDGFVHGKKPLCLAAAAVYAASLFVGESLTQRAVADISNVSTVTIRSHYQRFTALKNDQQRQ